MKKIDSKTVSFSLYIFLLIFGLCLLLFNDLDSGIKNSKSASAGEIKIENNELYLN